WHSDQERAEVDHGHGNIVKLPSVEAAVRYADQRTAEGQSVASRGIVIRIFVSHDLLRNLVIVDTPGLGASSRDDDVTYESLMLSDAALLVISALQPGGRQSLDLANRLATQHRRLTIVVARIDQSDNPTDAVDLVRQLFARVSDGAPIPVASPTILEASVRLREAEDARDSEAAAKATEELSRVGYLDLRDRIQR